MPSIRLFQISDLHVGPLTAGGLPYAPALYLRRPLNGWLGHDPLAARAVARFLRRLRRDDVPVHVVTTGDLTAWGDPAQFDKATAYLGDTVQDGPSRVGLREPDWLDRAIPGNHDHWAGARAYGTPWKFPQLLGPPAPPFYHLFGTLPQFGPPALFAPGLPPIRFIRVDTDADVRPYTRDRFLARGSFRSHLAWLDANLPPKPDGEIRVVLAHHCREVVGYALAIEPASRSAFDAFLVHHGIDVLLSGHTHEVGLSTPTITSPTGSRALLYARCGTSTAVNPRDERVKRSVGWSVLEALPLAKSAERSVVLHDVESHDGRTTWTATTYRLTRQNRFVLDLQESVTL